jgi:hypothetical protein
MAARQRIELTPNDRETVAKFAQRLHDGARAKKQSAGAS